MTVYSNIEEWEPVGLRGNKYGAFVHRYNVHTSTDGHLGAGIQIDVIDEWGSRQIVLACNICGTLAPDGIVNVLQLSGKRYPHVEIWIPEGRHKSLERREYENLNVEVTGANITLSVICQDKIKTHLISRKRGLV